MKNYQVLNGRKFMWDGEVRESREVAERVASGYKSDGFEAQVMEEDGKYIVYTRREVRTVAAEQPG